MQEALASLQVAVGGVSHTCEALQNPEQQSAPPVHACVSGVHTVGGSVQRAPSQAPVQHSVGVVQAAPLGLHVL